MINLNQTLMNKGTQQNPRNREDWHEKNKKFHKGVVICPTCHNILFKKSWHSADSKNLSGLKTEAALILCPACTMVKDHTYEGEITLVGIPPKYQTEMLHLIANFGAQAKKRDPQDRIIEIKQTKVGHRILTTENQMAVKMAKKIKTTFKDVAIDISFSKEPYEVSRVKITSI